MTRDEFLAAGLNMAHECEVYDDDGESVFIKYWLEASYDEEWILKSVFVETDWTYSFSFNSNSEDTPRGMLELAEELITDAWGNEDA